MLLELKAIQNTSANQLICKAANGTVITLGLDWHERPACSNKQREWQPPMWNAPLARNAVFGAPHRKKPTMGWLLIANM